MRRRALPSLTILLAVLATGPAAAAADWSLDDFVGRRSEWDGFPVGTSVHVRRTLTRFVPGADEATTRTDEVRRKLVEKRDDEIVLDVSQKVGGRWTRARRTVPLRDPSEVKTEDLGEATLRVGEADFPCRKTRVRRPGPRGREELVLWVNARHGILRIELRAPSVSTITATELGREVDVGGRTIAARVFALETGGEGPTRRGTLVLSPDVPEAMVSEDVRVAGTPSPLRTRSELVALELPEPEDTRETPAQDGQESAPPR